jgi:hypothetical protein
MAHVLEAGQLLDIEMDQFAGALTLIAARRLLRLEGSQAP